MLLPKMGVTAHSTVGFDSYLAKKEVPLSGNREERALSLFIVA
jgi:hypothetical protein